MNAPRTLSLSMDWQYTSCNIRPSISFQEIVQRIWRDLHCIHAQWNVCCAKYRITRKKCKTWHKRRFCRQVIRINLSVGTYIWEGRCLFRLLSRLFISQEVFRSSLHVFGSGLGQAEDRARHAVQLALQEIEKCQSFSPNKLFPSTIFAQVWEWLTSKKINLDDPTLSLVKEIQGIIRNQPVERSIYFLIPFLGYITNNFNRKIERAKDIKKQLFSHEFSAHRETYNPGVIRDLTDSFISAYEKEIANGIDKDIGSIEDIPDLMLDVAVAAIDTISHTISWFILYNVLHQDIQAKLHKELDDVVENDRLPCWQDAQNMPYLQATLCEVLRRSEAVPLTGTTTIRNTTIAGFHIPKNTKVIINIDEIHHDPKEWPEPNEFKPERFLDSDGKFVGWTTKHAFMPFGLGRRECLGQLFARIVMFTFASTLLHLYKIELPEGAEKPSTSPIGIEFHQPKDFTVVAKKRH